MSHSSLKSSLYKGGNEIEKDSTETTGLPAAPGTEQPTTVVEPAGKESELPAGKESMGGRRKRRSSKSKSKKRRSRSSRSKSRSSRSKSRCKK